MDTPVFDSVVKDQEFRPENYFSRSVSQYMREWRIQYYYRLFQQAAPARPFIITGV